MKHMNKIAMALGIVIICAAAYFGVRYYQAQRQDNVKVQGAACFGICGQNSKGEGWGIGIGGGNGKPFIGVGPYDNSQKKKNKNKQDVEVQGYYSSNE